MYWRGRGGMSSGHATEKLGRACGLSAKQSFRIETPAGLSHGRNFFDPDVSQIARLAHKVKQNFAARQSGVRQEREIKCLVSRMPHVSRSRAGDTLPGNFSLGGLAMAAGRSQGLTRAKNRGLYKVRSKYAAAFSERFRHAGIR